MRRVLRGAAIVVSLLATLRLANATPSGPVDDRGLVARAKAEGSVVLYGAITAAQLTAVAARFQSTYGISTTTLRIESDKLPGRVLTELQGGERAVDVVGDSVFQMELLRRAGAFAAFHPPEDRDLIRDAYDPAGSWSATIVNTEAIGYNPDRLRAAGIKPPQTWDDLAAKEWHENFGLFTGSYEWFAAMKRFFGKDRGEQLLRAYAANQPRLLTS
jgi:ABC-type Fe3+ transport system substrate-binding protein